MNSIEERSLGSKILAMVAAIALAMVLGAVDYLTGREWAISAFYLLPTCIAAWMAGRWAGFAMGGLCAGIWLLSDVFSGPAYEHPLIPVWNAVMLFVFFFVVVWLLTAFQRSHYYLEHTVERRTAALRAEIEERKRLEQAKLQGERLAVVGSMAAQVAHEIRNPLGSISLNIDLAGEELQRFANSSGGSTAECQVLLREMRSQVLRIRQVLQEYLRFARMPKSERAAISLTRFLEEKLNFVQPLLDQKHVDLRRTFDPNLPPVYVDAEQLWEAILNLISNALDAMPDGGNLTVSAQRHGTEALVAISDNGRGMTEEEARHLLFHSSQPRAMARASVSHTRSGSSMNMAVGLIALRREEKAVPLAFNFHLLLVHDMKISRSQLSGAPYLAVITTGGSNSWVWGMFEPGRFGVSPGAIL